MKSPRYFFLHIPKTGGVSLHRYLESQLGPYLHLRHPHELQWHSSPIWERFRGCGGHVPMRAALSRGFFSGFSFTLLRDPVERVLSQYSFSRQIAIRGQPDSIRVQTYALEELMKRSAGFGGSFWNAQTFALSSLPMDETSPDRNLASALVNLERFDFVGTTETLTADAPEIARLLNGNPDALLLRENQTPHRLERKELSNETLSLIEEAHRLDRVLYARAIELRTRKTPEPIATESSPLAGWPPRPSRSGLNKMLITGVHVCSAANEILRSGDEAVIRISGTSTVPLREVRFGIRIEDVIGNYIAGTNSFLINRQDVCLDAGAFTADFTLPITMGAGHYLVTVAIQRDSEVLCWIDSATEFDVEAPLAPHREGMVDIAARVSIASGR